MIVFGYVRVSSIEQEQGFGPDVQVEALRSYAQANDLSEPELVHESASAESIVQRVELKQILSRAKDAQERGEEAHVIMYRLDRLARNLLDQEAVVQHALRYGFRLHSTQAAEADTLNPAYAGDPMRVAIRQFFGIFSQLERATIQARLDSGLAAKAKEGGSTGGRLAFGYMSKDQDIAVDPAEAPVVVRVFQLHQHGLDLASIAAVCAREFPEQCRHWAKCNISRMLARRDLYQHGLYRSRLGVEAKARPELRIIPEGLPKLAPSRGGPIDWEAFPDPVPMMTLTLLLDRTSAWIQKQVVDCGIPVKWSKGRMLIARTGAEVLERVSREASSVSKHGA